MPTFEYQATRGDGQTVSGRLFALGLEGAARELEGQGLTVLRLGVAALPGDPLAPTLAVAPAPGPPRPVEAPAAPPANDVYDPVTGRAREEDVRNTHQRSYFEANVWGPLVDRVPLTALLFFFRQGATMLEAGVPIVQAMNTLAGQSRDGKLARIIREIGGHVEAGRPMSFGMQRYPEVFNGIIVSLTRAGEEGGFLDRALGQIADYLEREIALRNLYKRITFYPKLQVAASIIIIMGANLIIASVSGGRGQGLTSPLTTPSTWFWLGPLIIIVFLFLRVGLANGGVKYFWDAAITFIPGMGKILRELAMAKFGRAFGALYKGGVPLTRAVQLSADACGNEYLRSKMYPAVRTLESGAGITETLRQTGAFNPIVIDMVHTGETTGSLDQMLNKMAEFYEDEAATKSTQLAQIVGVVLGLLVAIYIGMIVINFYSGYFSGLMRQAE